MWWAHNGLQIHDTDWDINLAYYGNQRDEVILFMTPPTPVRTTATSVVPAMIQTTTASVQSSSTSQPQGPALVASTSTMASQPVAWTPPYPGSRGIIRTIYWDDVFITRAVHAHTSEWHLAP